MADVYIIFVDNKIEGYVNTEQEAINSMHNRADKIVEKKSKNNIRIFRENINKGIKIYSQELGNYFNGSLNLEHTIIWQKISLFNLV
jgi:hypothetical protein